MRSRGRWQPWLHRHSHRQISVAIAAAAAPESLVAVAAEIRESARSLVKQGLPARRLTRLISRLNDSLTRRMVELISQQTGVATADFCWLAFGSEGRKEQTIATDQDNGIVYFDRPGSAPQQQILLMAVEVNRWLDRCGYPLCRGNVMAGNPECCLTLAGWRSRFDHWLSRGSPQDLLDASIFFDLRPLAGNLGLGQDLHAYLMEKVPGHSLFLKLLSDNALRNAPPASLLPGVLGALLPDASSIDLKLSGTMPLVDGARLLALAHGISAYGTAERYEALMGRALIAKADCHAWVDAFEFLQSLRLKVQLEPGHPAGGRSANTLILDHLAGPDRDGLKKALGRIHELQQRLALDYP